VIDTVRLGVHLDDGVVVKVGGLVHRGWAVHSKRQVAAPGDERDQDDLGVVEDVWATFNDQGVRCAWSPPFRWLSAEASLPYLVCGDNAVLLTWDECRRGLQLLRERAGEALGVDLPDLDEWKVARADPVHAWGTDPTPYLSALRLARLPRTEPKLYDGSLAWVSRANRVQVRCYDKAREQGHPVDLPLRLERQVRRPNRYVVRDEGGNRVSSYLGAWDHNQVVSLVCAAMRDLGLDRPVPSPLAARGVLVEAYGQRKGLNLWRALLDAHTSGGWDMVDVSPRTRQRYQQDARDAGVRGVSLDGELPALDRPLSAF